MVHFYLINIHRRVNAKHNGKGLLFFIPYFYVFKQSLLWQIKNGFLSSYLPTRPRTPPLNIPGQLMMGYLNK